MDDKQFALVLKALSDLTGQVKRIADAIESHQADNEMLSFPLGDSRKSGWLPPSFDTDNRSGLMLIELPVGIADPCERLAETHRRVDMFAKAYDTQRALGIFSLIGQTPRAVQLQALVHHLAHGLGHPALGHGRGGQGVWRLVLPDVAAGGARGRGGRGRRARWPLDRRRAGRRHRALVRRRDRP